MLYLFFLLKCFEEYEQEMLISQIILHLVTVALKLQRIFSFSVLYTKIKLYTKALESANPLRQKRARNLP